MATDTKALTNSLIQTANLLTRSISEKRSRPMTPPVRTSVDEMRGKVALIKEILTELQKGTFEAVELPKAEPKVRKDAPKTSRDTAESLSKGDLNKQHELLLRTYASHRDGLTNERMELLTGLRGDSIRPRRGELDAAKLIEWTGRTARTRTGRQANVHAITQSGLKLLKELEESK